MITCLTNISPQFIRMRSAVAGLSNLKPALSLASILAELIASLIANNTEHARGNGGSPMACLNNIVSY